MSSAPLNDVEYRVGTVDDVASVSVAATHVFLDTYATGGLRPNLAREALSVYSPKAFFARLNDQAMTFVLAERGDHLLGFAEVMRERPCPCTPVSFNAELVRLYLLPVAQGQGLGRSLLRRAEEVLSSEGAAGLWLTAWSGNHRALDFYPAVGYEKIGLREYIIEGEAYENQVFAKALVRRAA